MFNETLALYAENITKTREVSDLVLQYAPLVLKIARSYARCPEELLDRIQDGNVGLCKAARDFDESRGDFGPYACLRIKSEIRNNRRDRLGCLLRRRSNPDMSFEDVYETTVKDRHSNRAEQSAFLSATLKKLPEKHRGAIVKRLEGQSLEEIAEDTGVTHQAVRSLIQSGVKRATAV